MVDAFIEIEVLQRTKGFDSVIARTVEESGLNSISTSTLVRLRLIYLKHQEFKRGK